MSADSFFLQAYELIVHSEIMLPGFIADDALNNKSIDVYIKRQVISPKGLSNPIEQGLFFQVNPDEIWLSVPGIARFLISKQRILFDAEPGVTVEVLSTFLNGPCMAALLMHRELFVLMGSVVQHESHAIAYIGDGCSGKSSLVAALLNRGYKMMSDGMCVINKKGWALPGPRYIELSADVMEQLNISANDEQIVKPALKKYRIPVQNQYHESSLLLTKIYVLNPHKNKEMSYKKLMGSEKMNHVQKNIYNKLYVTGLKKNALYFQYVAQLARQVNMALIEFNGIKFDIQEISNYVDCV